MIGIVKSMIRSGIIMATAGAAYHIGKNVGESVGEKIKDVMASKRRKTK